MVEHKAPGRQFILQMNRFMVVVTEDVWFLLQVSTTAQVLPKKKSVMCEVCTQILVLILCVLLFLFVLPWFPVYTPWLPRHPIDL